LNKAYRYDISFTYQYGNNTYISDIANIRYLTVEYNYEATNMPILIMNASLDKRLIDDMIKNQGKKNIVLTIKKYIIDQPLIIKEIYIQEEFTYFISSNDINKNDVEDYLGEENKSNKDITKIVNIGLLSEKLINNNKITINEVAKNTTLMDLICYHMRHMKLLIEPMNNKNISEFIIPPCDSISKLLAYVNRYYTFYKDGYRLFYDFDKTYLLSNTTNYVKAKGDKYNDIFITISESTTRNFIVQGMEIDDITNKIDIDIPMSDISISEDTSTSKSYDKLIAITPDGKHKEIKLNLNGSNLSNGKKTKIVKLQTSNLDTVYNYKNIIEGNSTIITCIKTELDSSIFTMNRIYTIKSESPSLKNKTGKYRLIRKNEIYTINNAEFILNDTLVFKRI